MAFSQDGLPLDKPLDIDKVESLWVEGYTYDEIAIILQVSRMHLWRQRRRWRNSLKHSLEDQINHLVNREGLYREGKIPIKRSG